jgi:hypothetical protein
LAGSKPGIRDTANTAMNITGSSLFHFSFTPAKDNSLRGGDKFSIRCGDWRERAFLSCKMKPMQKERSGFRQKAAFFNFQRLAALYRDAATANGTKARFASKFNNTRELFLSAPRRIC